MKVLGFLANQIIHNKDKTKLSKKKKQSECVSSQKDLLACVCERDCAAQGDTRLYFFHCFMHTDRCSFIEQVAEPGLRSFRAS